MNPSNIMVDEKTLNVKIVDFGVSKNFFKEK